jgi:hypothetical protein
VEHPQVLASHDMNELTCLNMSDFDEVWLKRQDVGVVESKRLWRALPLNSPVLSRSPTISVNEEREFGVIEQEFAIQTLNVNWLDVLSPCDEIERRIRLVK